MVWKLTCSYAEYVFELYLPKMWEQLMLLLQKVQRKTTGPDPEENYSKIETLTFINI